MKKIAVLMLLFAVAFGVTVMVLDRGPKSRPERDADLAEAVAGAGEMAAEVLGRLHAAGEVAVDETELRFIVLAQLADSPWGRRLLEASRDLTVEIGDDSVAVGIRLASAEIEEALDDQGASGLGIALRILALVPGGETYLGVRGTPRAVGGMLAVDASTVELEVGPIRLSPAELEDRIGVSSERLAESLTIELSGFLIGSVETVGGRLMLRGRSTG